MFKIGDIVKIKIGKYKGKIGRVLAVDDDDFEILIFSVNETDWFGDYELEKIKRDKTKKSLFQPKGLGKVLTRKQTIKKLKLDNRIESIKISLTHIITARTGPVYVKGKYVGEYDIKINLKSNIWKMFRVQGTVGDKNHMFINSEGHPCFGNLNKFKDRVRENKDYYTAVMMCLELLDCTKSREGSGDYYITTSNFLNTIRGRAGVRKRTRT